MGKIYQFSLFFFCCFCLTGCNSHNNHAVVRPELGLIFNEVILAKNNGCFNEETRKLLDSTLAVYKPLNQAELLSKYDFYQWYYAEYKYRQYDSANRVIDSALWLLETKNDPKLYAENYQKWVLFKGDVLVHLKRLTEAFFYYYKVKMNPQVYANPCQSYQLSIRLGNVRYMQHNFLEARKYFKQALEEHGVCEQDKTLTDYYQSVTEPQGLLNGIAMFYEAEGKLDSALYYYRTALQLLEEKSPAFPSKKLQTQIAKGVIFGNLGGLLAKMGRYMEAERYLIESIKINDQPSYDNRDVITAKIKLAGLYTEINKLPQAKLLLEKSEQALDSLPDDMMMQLLKYNKWIYLKKKGTNKEVYTALQDYYTYRDSVASTYEGVMNSDFVSAFEMMGQASALERLALKNRQNFVSLVVSVIILALSLAIEYLIYRNWVRSQKHIAKLKKLNDRVKERNHKLKLTLTALQESQQDNTRIMAMVAHDLRSHVASIKLGAEFLLGKENISLANQKEMLTLVRTTSYQALDLMGDLMYSYENRSSDSNTVLDMESMIQDCVALLKLRSDEKQQVLHVKTEQLFFFGNGEKLWRVISNLIINAIKFTPTRGKIVVKLEKVKDKIHIEVSDNGIGIPETILEQLFSYEKDTRRTGTEGESSTGLGLVIVKQIVSAYTGDIEVESKVDEGTTFRVLLPCYKE